MLDLQVVLRMVTFQNHHLTLIFRIQAHTPIHHLRQYLLLGHHLQTQVQPLTQVQPIKLLPALPIQHQCRSLLQLQFPRRSRCLRYPRHFL